MAAWTCRPPQGGAGRSAGAAWPSWPSAWGLQAFLSARAAQDSQAFARIHAIATASLIPETGDAPAARRTSCPTSRPSGNALEAALKEADSFISVARLGPAGRGAAAQGAATWWPWAGPPRRCRSTPQLTGSLDQRLWFLAQEGLAYAQESSGQIDKAIESFGPLAERAKAPDNFMRDRALFNQARLLERKGARKDAEKVYREILTELPQSALKDEINDRLAVLEGK